MEIRNVFLGKEMREWTRNTKKLVGKAKGHAFAGDNTGVVRHYVALFCVLQPI